MRYLIACLLLTQAITMQGQTSLLPEDDAYNTMLGQMQESYFTQHFNEFRWKYDNKFRKDDTATPDTRERYVYYTFCMAEINALEGRNKEAWNMIMHLVKYKEFENWDDIVGNVAFDTLRMDSKTKPIIVAASQRLIADATNEKDPQLAARLKVLSNRDRTNTQYNAEDSTRFTTTQNSLTDSAVQILDKYGYPGPALVGAQATVVAHVISKAPLEVKKKYKTLFYTEGLKGNIPNGLAGVILDQISVAEKGKQQYGTQYHIVKGNTIFYPTEDVAKVEARRKKMGFKLSMKEEQKRVIEGR